MDDTRPERFRWASDKPSDAAQISKELIQALPLARGPNGVDISGIGDSTHGNEGAQVNVGASIGYETQITAAASVTIGDIVRGIVSVLIGSDVPWHGDNGCICQ